MATAVCPKGHKKVMRSEGLFCAVCANIRTKIRLERAYASGAKIRPGPRWKARSTPVDDKCAKGHAKVRNPSGGTYCQVCVNSAKRAKSKGCTHYREPDYDHVINTKGHDICLVCLARDANGA